MFTRILVCGLAIAISAFLVVFGIILAILVGYLICEFISDLICKLGW